MHFAVVHRFRADPVAVAAVLLDPAFHTELDLPDLSRPEIMGADAHSLHLRYEFVGHLDPVARKLLSGRRLTWLQDVELDAATGRGRLSFAAEADPQRLHGAASVVLDSDGTHTTRCIEGDLHVRAPLIGGTAERRIVPGLIRRLDVEAAAAAARLAGS